MPSAATFGGKVGGFVTENFSIDGNLSWYNHMVGSDPDGVFVFRPVTNTIAGIASGLTSNDDVKTRALLWEASGNYNFGHSHGYRTLRSESVDSPPESKTRMKSLLPAADS
jgi:hypothetical protein